jgi:hypothetical protein
MTKLTDQPCLSSCVLTKSLINLDQSLLSVFFSLKSIKEQSLKESCSSYLSYTEAELSFLLSALYYEGCKLGSSLSAYFWPLFDHECHDKLTDYSVILNLWEQKKVKCLLLWLQLCIFLNCYQELKCNAHLCFDQDCFKILICFCFFTWLKPVNWWWSESCFQNAEEELMRC